jgi:hypothetical protein
MGSELYRIYGTDLTAIPSINSLTGYTVLAEVGTDWSRFRNGDAFASWTCLCPQNKKSGGKILSAHTRRSANRVNRALRLAAQTLEKNTSYLCVYYRKMRARHGAPAAITAAAHKLARIIFHLVTTGEAYDETLFAAQEQRQRKRMENKLKRTAQQLGYRLIPLGPQIVTSLKLKNSFASLAHPSGTLRLKASPSCSLVSVVVKGFFSVPSAAHPCPEQESRYHIQLPRRSCPHDP